MAGKPQKEFQDYLEPIPSNAHVSHHLYKKSPAKAFLKYTIEAKDSLNMCKRHFPKTKNNTYTQNAQDSLHFITVAFLPTVMGHFETYQRYLFAGSFDFSIFLKKFSVNDFFKKSLDKFQIDPVKLAAYRGRSENSIGMLLADNIQGWHNPAKVNKIFDCFNFKNQLYKECYSRQLMVLWQLRHSIVHTGGTLTCADAQKINELNALSGKEIFFQNNFIFEVARKLHRIVKDTTERFSNKFKSELIDDLDAKHHYAIDKFFEVRSSVSAWLK